MKPKVLLFYTELGFAGSYVVQAPISLVYIATRLFNNPDVEIEIIDCRVENNWQTLISRRLAEDNILMAGFFVMSGLQVSKAYEVTKFIKSQKDVPIVWGGPHPTILPKEVMDYGLVDFCIRGFGIGAFTDLVKGFIDGRGKFEAIPNLCFKKSDGEIVIGEINSQYERIHFKDLPYHLLDPFIEKYFQNKKHRDFPIYTSFGCPYLCNFCISPIWFKDTNKKWDPLPAQEVVDHIEFLQKRYRIDLIYFWDDDTFVRPSHFTGIAREIVDRGLKVQIGVRGIRANEVDRMKKEDFDLLEAVGVKYLHIGIENGSQRILDLMQKGIRVEQSLETNRKLAEYKNIIPMYNMLCGIPTETIEDLQQTGLFMLQIANENPNCIIFDPGKLIPYPGGNAFELAVKHGYISPKTPQDWSKLDQEEDVIQPWYTPQYNQYIHMLEVTSYAISNWEKYLEDYPGWLRWSYKVIKFFYKPIAVFRLKAKKADFLIEHRLLDIGKKIVTALAPSKRESS